MDFSKQLFRASSIGNLMKNQQGKKDTKTIDELSESAKAELVKIYVHAVYGRDKEITSKYMDKGIQVEEDSLTLVSRVHGVPYFKNDKRLINEYLTGEPDVIDPLLDMKSCWDIHTFFERKTKKLDTSNEYQMLAYCELTGHKSGRLIYTLIDTPQGIIEAEKMKMFYRMNPGTTENEEYKKACEHLEREMTFADIPMKDRIHEITVKHNPAEIERVYRRAELWREWLNEFTSVKELIEA
jgi:hypothetical protein